MENNTRDPMLELYRYETQQLIDKLEQLVISDEQSANIKGGINEIFRIMHTIKGNSAMMLFNNISKLAHSLEDLYDYLRTTDDWIQKGIDPSSITDIVLEGADFIKLELDKLDNNLSLDGNESKIVVKVKELLNSLKGENTNQDDKKKEKQTNLKKKIKYYVSSLKADSKEEAHTFDVSVYFEEGCEMEDIRAFTLAHSLKDICDEIDYSPTDILENPDCKEIIRSQGFDMKLTTQKAMDYVRDFIEATPFVNRIELKELQKIKTAPKKIVLDESENTEEKIPTENKEPNIKSINERINAAEEKVKKEVKAQTAGAAVQHKSGDMISVSLSKLDKLMDLVGELVISEAMVTGNPELADLQLDSFYKAARQLRKITDELQDIAMSVRMVSVAPTFQKMQRLVRDMSKKTGKAVKLELLGQETEVDKNIIDSIGDPLMHLIRNAIDHGIEDQDERRLKGKPAEGSIILEAKSIGSDIWIIIQDDGKGLNKEKIYSKAVEKDLTTKNIEELSDKEIFSFIFQPGFSTNDNVTEFSGRGVGMDVVQKNIDSVRGSIFVDSKLNEGTTISMKIPLTLSIVDGMTIKVAESRYTLPITSIKESIKIKNEEIITDMDGNDMVMLRGNSYPVIRLHRRFNIKTNKIDLHDGIIILVENSDKTMCIFADELLGEQQVVVKTLPSYMKRVKGIAGCTILGDGGISLILNIEELLNE